MNDVEKWCPEPLWLLAQPLPDAPQRHQCGGRRRLDDRVVLAAILYVLRTGCAWSALPASFGVSTPTAHRRFTEWAEADIFARLPGSKIHAISDRGSIPLTVASPRPTATPTRNWRPSSTLWPRSRDLRAGLAAGHACRTA